MQELQLDQKKLHLQDVSKSFGGRKVVDIPELIIGRHGIEGLIGPNGAGKTSLMGLITSTLQMDTGRILYFPQGEPIDISVMSLDTIARMGLVKTNQIIQDFDSLTIRESLLFSLTKPSYEQFWSVFSSGGLEDEAQAEIDFYLDYFQFQDVNGHALSAGEKKLLDIIRCLVLKPRFLLMDEPTAGLPDDVTRQVMDLMLRKTEENGMSILIVEHDLDLIWEVCEYVHFMAEGKIMTQGTPEQIREHRTVAEKYFGAHHV